MEDREDIRQLVEKYLDNEATLIERARLDSWLEEDEQVNTWLSARIDSTSEIIDPDVRSRLDARIHEIYESAECDDIMHRNDSGNHHTAIWRIGMAAAVAVIATLSGMLIYNHVMQPAEQPLIVSTRAGERSQVTLPDGSTLHLNHQTEISYRYDHKKDQRVLDLHGEAAFDIETDPEHPFIVNCDGLNIECKGTSFNVKGYPDEGKVTVVLADGAITASTTRQSITMKPGTMVSYDKQMRHMSSTMVDANDYYEWTNGCDRFNDERFDDILRTISRRYGVSISLLTPSLRDVRLSGSLSPKTLDETLGIISAAAGASYIMESDSTICFYREP